YQVITFPLQWTASQILFLLPGIGLMALALVGGRGTPAREQRETGGFARRYVTARALGPFAFTPIIAVALARLPVAKWGLPLWSFAPLAALMWLGPVTEPIPLRRFTAGFIAVFVAIPLIYLAVELGEPLVRDRPKATQFPGRAFAAAVTQAWRDRYGTP